MSDIIDEANEAADLYLQVARKAHKRFELPYTGRCHNCQASVPLGHKFCDADCRDDCEKFSKLRQKA